MRVEHLVLFHQQVVPDRAPVRLVQARPFQGAWAFLAAPVDRFLERDPVVFLARAQRVPLRCRPVAQVQALSSHSRPRLAIALRPKVFARAGKLVAPISAKACGPAT
jgi:hypothetical protein